jgi:glycosyltransferase-like protein
MTLSIGLFTYSTKPRGSVVHAACLAEALADAGHAVTLVALDKDGAGFYRSLRVPCVCVRAEPAAPGSEGLIAQRIAELARFLARERPRFDVVHAEDCLVAGGLLAARASLGQALLCRTVHHVEQFESPYLEACQQRSIRGADLVLSVSAATQGEVWSRYGCQARIVESGVDLDRFARGGDGPALRARFAIPEDAPLMLSIGGVEPRKNSLNMLEAFVRARRAVPSLRWLIVGGASIFEHADYRSAFAARLAALSPEDARAVHTVGVLADEDMSSLYAAAGLLLYASLQEGFGLCVLEAMAARCPVVVSRGAPFDEYLDDACALRTDPHDPDAIAWAVVRALRPDPARLSAARARAERFAWPRSANRHVDLYRAALTQRASRHDSEPLQRTPSYA